MIDNSIHLLVYFILFAVILFLFWDRWQQEDRADKKEQVLLDQLSAANKAIIAKNANEYTMMRTMDGVVEKEKEQLPDSEFVDESSLEDDEFFDTVEKRSELAK